MKSLFSIIFFVLFCSGCLLKGQIRENVILLPEPEETETHNDEKYESPYSYFYTNSCPPDYEEQEEKMGEYTETFCRTAGVETPEGPYRVYHGTSVVTRGQYYAGRMHGEWVYWHDPQAPPRKNRPAPRHFKSAQGQYDLGEKLGLWVYWNKRGKFERTECWPFKLPRPENPEWSERSLRKARKKRCVDQLQTYFLQSVQQ